MSKQEDEIIGGILLFVLFWGIGVPLLWKAILIAADFWVAVYKGITT